MRVTFWLLGAAILSAWIPQLRLGANGPRIALWPLLLFAAVAAGMIEGYVQWSGVISIAILVALASCSRQASTRAVRVGSTVLTMIVALALALHVVPGFSNPAIVVNERLSENATPYSLWLNFDKASAGLVLLVFYSPRCSSATEWLAVLRSASVALPATALTLFSLAVAVGYVGWLPKLPEFAAAFLAVNLLFTCIAEEAFFRGMAQRWLARNTRGRWATQVVIFESAALFALAHAAGGYQLVAFAALAGLGYALAFSLSEQIEAAILTHFGVNALHFLLFTYPSIQGARP